MKAATRTLTAIAAVLIATAGLGLASTGPAVAVSAAEVCSDHHDFGLEPVPVAKTADGSTVLAQVRWQWNASIGCYLSLDDQAISTLRAHAAELAPPAAISDETATRCFEHHRFGQQSVPVAKTADGTTVLAQVQWGWDDSIGCYLSLDNQALETIRAAAAIPIPTFTSVSVGKAHTCAVRIDQAIVCWGSNDDGQLDAPEGQYTAIAAGGSHTCALRTDQTINCWGNNNDGQLDAPEGQYTAMAAGGSHTCALRTDQTI
ncbi:MAG: hypothetical protein F4240_01770, partial [Acidimicrobiia bacterium]|nr:hypothetical protein [Acidimicrobiia bacterium]